MEEQLIAFASLVALAIEAMAVLVLAVVSAMAAVRLVRVLASGEEALAIRKAVWLKFAVGIALALEFMLAADIVRSVIAPTWEVIGLLAAIATIRTVLNLFLMRDIEALREGAEAHRG
jgi:uncharacterized membrane protein